ncbi:DMT family transporter [Tepidimonas taiwanensis]|uniref:DMT family transporter n=1 Tax=Tepidimonas taiwanensis TaxID=307486 RepID=UPI0007346C4B|nr:DMT family transporter [Tepidimonas taiwanensis]
MSLFPLRRWPPGIGAALAAAVLFGAAAPLAKLLLAQTSPWLMAGLLYAGSGLGLALVRGLWRAPAARLAPQEWPWLIGAIVSGGVIGPVLLMVGLSGMPASGAALLLNAEGVLTAALAWWVFRENVDRRLALGMLAIVAGAVVLSWPARHDPAPAWPALAVLAACLAWAVDNNLTRKVALADASWIAMVKGLAAGAVNLALASWQGAVWPPLPVALAAMALGWVAYGISLTLFVQALRHLGTARAGAYFSVAPFFGAALAVPLLGEPLTAPLLLAAALMGLGVWLHVSERHEHFHVHEALEHAHEHEHDEHHRHHAPGEPVPRRHTHWHRHEPLVHTHPHYPDEHHRHAH